MREQLLVAWVTATSVVAFVLCVVDKRRARRADARIRERTLLGAALVGGSPGLLLGMLVARHKTRKASFLAKLALVLVAQLVGAWLVLRGWP